MEAHPVPQNVTAFEFHLVGDMTIKQFAYLASGLGLAYITFVTIGTKFPLIAWPLIIIFSLLGVAFAFLPISERPLDHWLVSFIRSVFSPTQRVWTAPKEVSIESIFPIRLNIFLSSINSVSQEFEEGQVFHNSPNVSAVSQMAPKAVPMVSQPVAQQPPPQVTPPTQTPQEKPKTEPLPSPQELAQTVELAKKAQTIQTKIVDTEHQLNQIKGKAAMPGADPKEFSDDFQRILNELQELTNQASDISKQMASLSKAPQTSNLRNVVPAAKKATTTNIVLTTTPNILSGIVTDSANNYLEGVIVVTHNIEGLPVRALKTNKLGQFVAATPLPNGEYTLSLERDNLSFDTIAISLDGKVLPPVLVAARKGALS